ncbi:hypothetical protein VTI74DRAFT_3816 [Chaetomium olivicolor]
MISRQTYRRLVVLLAFAWLVVEVQARGGGGHGGGGGHSGGAHSEGESTSGTGGTKSGGSSSGNSGTGSSSDYSYYFLLCNGRRPYPTGKTRHDNEVRQALDYRRIHGIMAALAFVVLFPVGSIILRIVPGRFAVWAHAIFQMVAWCVWAVAVGFGITVVTMVKIPRGNLLNNPSTNYHPIIGLVLLGLLVLQPIFGTVHHQRYKKAQKRQAWSYMHLFIGRAGITLGIVNGGLGLVISNAPRTYKTVYAIVGAIMWAIWMAVAFWTAVRRRKDAEKGNTITSWPQFLLRNFAHRYKPDGQGSGKKKGGEKRKYEKGMHPGDLVVRNIDLFANPPAICEKPVNRILGQINMQYTSKPSEHQQHIEKMFPKLEARASEIFRKITKAYEQKEAGLWLMRSEKDLLRNFLFLLKYRSDGFYRRFFHDGPEGYDERDRESLREYMAKRGFKRPVGAWFHNIKTIIELEMDPGRKWVDELCRTIYFGIFEGPNCFVKDIHTGEMGGTSYMPLHEFAPISPKS